MAKRKKKYSAMTTAELREATRHYDQEHVAAQARPLSKTDKARFRRAAAKARAGRPKIGKGAERVLITMERGLLGEVDAYAKRHNVSRSQLIAGGVRMAMATRRKAI